MILENEVAVASARANTCFSAFNAMTMFKNSTSKVVEVKKIYRLRWIELTKAEVEAAKTLEEIEALYESVGHGGNEAAKVCINRWTQLAEAKAKACVTIAEVQSLLSSNKKRVIYPSGGWFNKKNYKKTPVWDVYHKRLCELAEKNVKEAGTLEQLFALYNSEKLSHGEVSELKQFYQGHLRLLAKSVAVNTVKAITTEKEATRKARSKMYSPSVHIAHIYLERAYELSVIKSE